jgi:hypothetical protein
MDTNIGSMALRPRDPRHVHGDGNDGRTTIAGKAAHMAGGIDLRLPVRSMRRHRQWRTRLVVLLVMGCVIGYLALRWGWRML